MFRACATIGGTQKEEGGRDREEAAFFKPKSARRRPGGRPFFRVCLSLRLHSDSRTSPNAMAVSLSYGHLVRSRRRRLCVRDNGSRPDPMSISRRFSTCLRNPTTKLYIARQYTSKRVMPWTGVPRREVLARRSRGLSENRYDSFSFGRAIAIASERARVALKKWGSSGGTTAEWDGRGRPGNVSIFLPLYKVQCFTKDEIHI